MREKEWEGNKQRDKGYVRDAQDYILIINPHILFFECVKRSAK